MAAEWTKLWSVRSTMWTLVATVVAVVGLCALGTGTVNPSEIIDDPTRRSLIGIFLGQLIFGVLGVLVMSAEYGTGTIRATLSAVPRRPVVLSAKVVVFGAVAVVVSEILAFTAFAVGQAILSAKHAVGSSAAVAQRAQQLGVKVPHDIQAALSSSGSASLGQAGVLRAVVGAGLYLAVLGLMALGLATIIRHTAGAISAFVGVVLVLPLIVQALPDVDQQRRGPLPTGQHRPGHVLHPRSARSHRAGFQPVDGLRPPRVVHRGDPRVRLLGPGPPRRLTVTGGSLASGSDDTIFRCPLQQNRYRRPMEPDRVAKELNDPTAQELLNCASKSVQRLRPQRSGFIAVDRKGECVRRVVRDGQLWGSLRHRRPIPDRLRDRMLQPAVQDGAPDSQDVLGSACLGVVDQAIGIRPTSRGSPLTCSTVPARERRWRSIRSCRVDSAGRPTSTRVRCTSHRLTRLPR